MTTVPFENLDVYARRGVEAELDWSMRRIVADHRGGWCFELKEEYPVAAGDWDATLGRWCGLTP